MSLISDFVNCFVIVVFLRRILIDFNFIFQKISFGLIEMAQWLKGMATKPDDLRLIPGIHRV